MKRAGAHMSATKPECGRWWRGLLHSIYGSLRERPLDSSRETFPNERHWHEVEGIIKNGAEQKGA